VARDIFEKINFIIKAIFDPCDAPLTIWIETAKPALLEAFLTYYLLDMTQILTTYLRPSKAIARARFRRKGGMGSKAGRKGKKGIISRVIGIDPSDEIGKIIPGAEHVRGRRVTGGVIHLWVVFGVIERINYFWFLISIIIDFFYNWWSGLAKTIYCQLQSSAVLVTINEHLPQLGAAGWAATPLGDVMKIRGEIEVSFNNIALGAYPWNATITATVRNQWDTPAESGIRFQSGPSEGSAVLAETFVQLAPGAEASITLSYTGRGPAALSIRDRCTGANTDLYDLTLIVQSLDDA